MKRENVMEALRKYFSIGNSYTYELTRVKSAFEVGTISLDDFEEWGEENISDLCDYLMRELFGQNIHSEWMSAPEMWGMFDVRYYCSKCGNHAIINSRERYVLSDYCPHCGAIMDNKRGNEND